MKLLVVFLLAGCFTAPQAPLESPISLTCVGPCEIQVSTDNVNEFSLAVNPLDPNHVIIVGNNYDAGYMDAMVTDYRMHALWGSIWTTLDGGNNWTHEYVEGRFLEESSLRGQDFVGDLVVTFGPDGTAYVAGIAYGSTGTTHHKLFVTANTGSGWSSPVIVDNVLAEFHDKPALLVTDKLYMVWNYDDGVVPRDPLTPPAHMKWATSTDGTNWEVGTFADSGYGISASLAQAPDGTIHAVYRTYDPLAILHRSSPDGQTWSEPHTVIPVGTASVATNNATFRSFVLPDLTILDDGRLVAVAADKNEDLHGSVLVSISLDGVTWNTTRIDAGHNASRFLAAVGSEGTTPVVTWLEMGSDDHYNLFAAVQDGGWHTQQITTASSDTDGFFIGDYMEVDVVQGQVYMAWPDSRSGETDLFAGHWALSN